MRDRNPTPKPTIKRVWLRGRLGDKEYAAISVDLGDGSAPLVFQTPAWQYLAGASLESRPHPLERGKPMTARIECGVLKRKDARKWKHYWTVRGHVATLEAIGHGLFQTYLRLCPKKGAA